MNRTHVNDPSCQCDACQRDRSKTFAKKNQALADAMHARRRVSHPTEYDDAKPTNCPYPEDHALSCPTLPSERAKVDAENAIRATDCPHGVHPWVCETCGPHVGETQEAWRARTAKTTNCPHGFRLIDADMCGACMLVRNAAKETNCPHTVLADGVCQACGFTLSAAAWDRFRRGGPLRENCPPCPHRSAGAPACNDCRAVALEDLVHFLVGAVHEPWIGPFVTECIAKIDEGKPWRTATK